MYIGSSSYILKDIAKCSTILCENIPILYFVENENLNKTYVSRDSRTSCQLAPPFIINKHFHSFGTCNPKYQCYLTSVIQLLLPILRTISHNLQFNSSMEGSLTKCLFETAHSASNSTDVDALQFRLLQYDTFNDGQIQQHSSECLMMLIEVFNKGSVPCCGSYEANFTGVSLSDIFFSLC